jgi:hypothetical protein
VLAYGATAGAHGDDSPAFRRAIAAASRAGTSLQPGIVMVPRGSYRVGNVYLQSNVDVRIAAGAVITMPRSVTGNEAVFILGNRARLGASWIHNATIEGVGGSFTMNLARTPTPRNHGITLLNVVGFRLENIDFIQNDANRTGAAPSSYAAAVTAHSTTASRPGGPYFRPVNGLLRNLRDVHAPYGFGLTQITSGKNLVIRNLRSQGGVALRFETDGNGSPSRGRLADVRARNVTCVDGRAAVIYSPHGQNNADVNVSDVTANSCQDGVRIANTGGSFVDSHVRGLTVTAGDLAQRRNPAGATAGSWVIGRSVDCVKDVSHGAFHVAVTSVTCPPRLR